MAGRPRRRRASNSTVATVDDSQIRWAKESSILKPSPRDVPDNDWPCYVLTDATIYRKDGKTLANPLLVHLQGPLVIRGLLEVDDDDLFPKCTSILSRLRWYGLLTVRSGQTRCKVCLH